MSYLESTTTLTDTITPTTVQSVTAGGVNFGVSSADKRQIAKYVAIAAAVVAAVVIVFALKRRGR